MTAAAQPLNTVRWSKAAHRAGLDGLVWMSRLCNDAAAYVFYGDRCADAFVQDATFGRLFAVAPISCG